MESMAKSSMVIFMVLMALFAVCFGAVYKVGDSHGWTDKAPVDYKSWSHSKHFVAGDTLVFEYEAKFDNLVQVDRQQFKECKADDPFFTSDSGNVHVMLTPGNFFYISSVPGHCEGGQKLHVKVYASSSGPSLSLAPSFPSPSPSPSFPPRSLSPTSSGPSQSSRVSISPSTLVPYPPLSSTPRPSFASPSMSPSSSSASSSPSSSTPISSPTSSAQTPGPFAPASHSSPSSSASPSRSPSSSLSRSPNGSPSQSPSGSLKPITKISPSPQKAQIAKSQAPRSSNGLPIVSVLVAVVALAYLV